MGDASISEAFPTCKALPTTSTTTTTTTTTTTAATTTTAISIVIGTTTTTAAPVCTTTQGAVCVFPFTYMGVTYTSCTNAGGFEPAWCSTKTDAYGKHVL